MAVYKRKDIWWIDYYINLNGKKERRREPVGSRRDEAVALLHEYRLLVKSGIDPREVGSDCAQVKIQDRLHGKGDSGTAELFTLEEFVPTFMTLHGEHQSEKMQESYNTSLGHLLPVFGNDHLDAITKVKVQAYMANRKEEASKATVNREVACLKGILSRAVEWDNIEKNPLVGLRLLKEAPIMERYLTSEEAERLIEASRSHLRDIVIFALATGMRKSEIFGLTWNDVVINERFKFGEITLIGKGEKRRNIRMNRTVFEMLARRRKTSKSEYVFPSPRTGGRLDNVRRSFASALQRAGIENFRFHDLRHTAASWMVQGGADIYAVQKILGHSHVRTTQRYAHQSPEHLESQIGVLDEFLSPKKKSVEIENKAVGE
jgi:integrase